MAYSEVVISLVVNIAERLRARADARGWFCLDMLDAADARVTRLGWYERDGHGHLEVPVSRGETSSTGAGWIFAESYERDRSLGGFASASIVVHHDRREVYVEGAADQRVLDLADIVREARDMPTRAEARPEPAVAQVRWRDSDADYLSRVTDAIARLHDRPDHVICLTTRATVTSDGEIDPLRVYERLTSTLRAPRAAVIGEGDVALVTASPETFVRIAGGTIEMSPMKGTRRRGATPDEDATLLHELATSEKERQENTAVTRATCAELERICVPGSVRTVSACEVVTFAQVHQMVSVVSGQVRPGTTLHTVLAETFPGASMTGVPKAWAIDALETLESGPRGLYSGCYGWISEHGEDVQIAMAIRCAEISGNRASVGAGGGLTERSNPEQELAEVKLKARAVLQALGARYP